MSPEITPTDGCPCGKGLHYSDKVIRRTVEMLVAELGATMPITTPGGTWMVPRHYIALHGISAAKLPTIAGAYGWEPVIPDAPDNQKGTT